MLQCPRAIYTCRHVPYSLTHILRQTHIHNTHPNIVIYRATNKSTHSHRHTQCPDAPMPSFTETHVYTGTPMCEHVQTCVPCQGSWGGAIPSYPIELLPHMVPLVIGGWRHLLNGRIPPANATHLVAVWLFFLVSAIQDTAPCDSSKFLLGTMQAREGTKQKAIF